MQLNMWPWLVAVSWDPVLHRWVFLFLEFGPNPPFSRLLRLSERKLEAKLSPRMQLQEKQKKIIQKKCPRDSRPRSKCILAAESFTFRCCYCYCRIFSGVFDFDKEKNSHQLVQCPHVTLGIVQRSPNTYKRTHIQWLRWRCLYCMLIAHRQTYVFRKHHYIKLNSTLRATDTDTYHTCYVSWR